MQSLRSMVQLRAAPAQCINPVRITIGYARQQRRRKREAHCLAAPNRELERTGVSRTDP